MVIAANVRAHSVLPMEPASREYWHHVQYAKILGILQHRSIHTSNLWDAYGELGGPQQLNQWNAEVRTHLSSLQGGDSHYLDPELLPRCPQ